jgi:hypothetical protein
MRPDRARERGGAKIKGLLALLIFAGMGYCGWMIVPPYVNNYQLEDAMKTEARFALLPGTKKTDDQIRDDIFKEISDLGIPAHRDSIRIDNVDGALRISLDYNVPVDLPGYHLNLHFHPQGDSRSI